MNEIMYTIIEAIVSLSMVLIMRYFLPWCKLKLQSTMDEQLWEITQNVVKAIEQTAVKHGADKKEEALNCIMAFAGKKGIPVEKSQLEHLIETAVYVMNEESKVYTLEESKDE